MYFLINVAIACNMRNSLIPTLDTPTLFFLLSFPTIALLLFQSQFLNPVKHHWVEGFTTDDEFYDCLYCSPVSSYSFSVTELIRESNAKAWKMQRWLLPSPTPAILQIRFDLKLQFGEPCSPWLKDSRLHWCSPRRQFNSFAKQTLSFEPFCWFQAAVRLHCMGLKWTLS